MRLSVASCLLICLMAGPVSSYAQSPNPSRLFEIGMNALTGMGESHSDQNALDYIHRSADVGYPPAEVMLGYFYETGKLVTKDPAQALDWYRKAGKQDDRLADWLLGRLYFTGTGTPRDLDQAAAALKKSANQDDPFGQYLLGMVMLERAQYPQAAQWFRKSAMQGMPQAQQQLGLLMKQGQGMDVNKLDAYVWLLVSYNGGNQSAAVATNLAQLEAELGNAQVDDAKSKAHDLEQTTNRVVVARGCTGWPGEFNAIPVPPPPEIQDSCR